MNSRSKLATVFLSCSVLGAALTERFIDTGPLVCTVDPTCRHMTPDEIALAQPIFGDTIPYDEVRIFNRKPLYNRTPNAIASVHHNNMYLSDEMGNGRYNVTAEDPHAGDFVHELTHLWQIHALGIRQKTGDQSYEYDIKASLSFEEFNQEQQAEIVLGYFERRNKLNEFIARASQRQDIKPIDVEFRDRKIKEYCASLKPYEDKIIPSLPVTPAIPCAHN